MLLLYLKQIYVVVDFRLEANGPKSRRRCDEPSHVGHKGNSGTSFAPLLQWLFLDDFEFLNSVFLSHFTTQVIKSPTVVSHLFWPFLSSISVDTRTKKTNVATDRNDFRICQRFREILVSDL